MYPFSPKTPLSSRLTYNMEQNSMCSTVGPCWLSMVSWQFLSHCSVESAFTECSLHRSIGSVMRVSISALFPDVSPVLRLPPPRPSRLTAWMDGDRGTGLTKIRLLGEAEHQDTLQGEWNLPGGQEGAEKGISWVIRRQCLCWVWDDNDLGGPQPAPTSPSL